MNHQALTIDDVKNEDNRSHLYVTQCDLSPEEKRLLHRGHRTTLYECRILIGNILNIIDIAYGTTIEELSSENRSGIVREARQVAMYLICSLTKLRQVDIGSIFNRDHATVIHSRETILNECRFKEDFARKVANLQQFIRC